MSVTYLMGHDSCHKNMQCTAVYKLIKYLHTMYQLQCTGRYLFSRVNGLQDIIYVVVFNINVYIN